VEGRQTKERVENGGHKGGGCPRRKGFGGGEGKVPRRGEKGGSREGGNHKKRSIHGRRRKGVKSWKTTSPGLKKGNKESD